MDFLNSLFLPAPPLLPSLKENPHLPRALVDTCHQIEDGDVVPVSLFFEYLSDTALTQLIQLQGCQEPATVGALSQFVALLATQEGLALTTPAEMSAGLGRFFWLAFKEALTREGLCRLPPYERTLELGVAASA